VVLGADVPFGVSMMIYHVLGPNSQKPKFWGHEEAFQTKSAKKSNPHIFKNINQIDTKFDKLMRPRAEASRVVLHDDATIPRWNFKSY